jgi:pimeloyl-ACP methyl ester carboxylesterase
MADSGTEEVDEVEEDVSYELRIFGSRDLLMVFVHGGAFSGGECSFAYKAAKAIGKRLECTIIIPNHNKTSEKLAVMSIVECIDQRLEDCRRPVVLAGGSSGGYLAAVTANYIESERSDLKMYINGLVLLCPVIDPVGRELYLNHVVDGTVFTMEDLLPQSGVSLTVAKAEQLLDSQNEFDFDMEYSPEIEHLRVLMIAGGQDQNVPLYTLLKYMTLPSVETRVFGSGGHSLQSDPPTQVVDEIEVFINHIMKQ